MVDSVSFKKIQEDARGSISVLTFRDRNFEIFETIKGAARGGHYHKTDATMSSGGYPTDFIWWWKSTDESVFIFPSREFYVLC